MPDASPTVSVIVPIYNAAPYLDQALGSIEQQTLHEIEIVCLNDGSTDNSLDIIREHAARDPRIIVVDKANEGYGATCNQGLAMATGTWIAIVEPDDWIEPDMYADMVACADSFSTAADVPVDIVKTPYWRIASPDTAQMRKLNCSYKTSMKQCESPFTIAQHTDLLMHHPSIWSAIYRRSFLQEFDIRFLPIPGAGWADNPFLIETLCQARAIAYLDKAYYCYRAETAEKARSFYANSAEVPLQRWLDMADVLERIGVSDTAIWKALYHRGFLYVGNVLSEHDMSEPDIHAAIVSVFDRMDPAIVANLASVSPAMKSLYASLRGEDIPANGMRYLAHQIGKGIYSVRNIGLRETLALMKGD